MGASLFGGLIVEAVSVVAIVVVYSWVVVEKKLNYYSFGLLILRFGVSIVLLPNWGNGILGEVIGRYKMFFSF